MSSKTNPNHRLTAPVVNIAVANLLLAGYVDPESDGGLEQDLASRRYRALLPDEEYDSDEY